VRHVCFCCNAKQLKQLKKSKAVKEAAETVVEAKPTATGVHRTALLPYKTGDLFSSRGTGD
jgi:hypothetical protein